MTAEKANLTISRGGKKEQKKKTVSKCVLESQNEEKLGLLTAELTSNTSITQGLVSTADPSP